LLYGGHVVPDDKYNFGNIIARKGDSREDVIRRVFFLVEALR